MSISDLLRRAARSASLTGRRRRIAFVLSGGGNLGAVQVGMLRALDEAGVRPDMIVGCSVGAINGAGYAADPTSDGVDRLERLWRRMADGDPDLMPSPRLIPVLAQLARRGPSLHDRERLEQLLEDELPTKTFAGLTVPFTCVATDVESAGEHWFEHGRLVPALLASAALPAVYPALEYRGRSFIDGGVLHEINTAKAVAMGATDLYILHVGHLENRSFDIQRPFDGAVQAYWTARRWRMEEDLRRVPDHCTIHRLPAGSTPRLRFDDFSRAGELSDLAYDATSEYLLTGRAPEPVSGPISEPGFNADSEADLELLTADADYPESDADKGDSETAADSLATADTTSTDGESATSSPATGGAAATRADLPTSGQRRARRLARRARNSSASERSEPFGPNRR